MTFLQIIMLPVVFGGSFTLAYLVIDGLVESLLPDAQPINTNRPILIGALSVAAYVTYQIASSVLK